ncbi:MAG: hypothetical protein ACT4NY_27595 [Pseudonocardiales bacterium]
MLSERESNEIPETTKGLLELTLEVSKLTTEISKLTTEVAKTKQEVGEAKKEVADRIKFFELRFTRIEKLMEVRLEDGNIRPLASELRTAVMSGIESATRDLKYLLENAAFPTKSQPAELELDSGKNSSPDEMRIRRILTENWLQIAFGMIIALIAIAITVYLFSRAPR